MATVSGNNLVVKFGTESSETLIACSTSCSLSINQGTTEATCKDAEMWASQVESTKSWEITVDALYQDDDIIGTGGFTDLSQLIITGPNTCSVIFEDSGNPTFTTAPTTYSGTAIMTSCSLTGDANAPASYSATFTGNGALTYTVGTST